jgi:hypothetical protein
MRNKEQVKNNKGMRVCWGGCAVRNESVALWLCSEDLECRTWNAECGMRNDKGMTECAVKNNKGMTECAVKNNKGMRECAVRMRNAECGNAQ